ncbi:hypothetical protein EBZ39_15515, partial [bacterium]|nr:hypothetical protein [bacterium]
GKTKTAAELQADYNKKLAELQTTGSGAAKTVETAKQKFEKYTDALKSSTSAQKAFNNAQKASDKAATSLIDAQNDVRAKQKALNDAVNGYGADSDQAKKAQRELAAAQRNVAQAGFRVEEAVFAVSDAEKALAELRADPTSSAQAIRQAEIDLAQAKLNVADATDSEFEDEASAEAIIKFRELLRPQDDDAFYARQEAERLENKKYRKLLANGIVRGITSFVQAHKQLVQAAV